MRKFFTVTSLLVITFAAYLIYGGIHEFGEAAESEALEIAAPLAAIAYGAGLGSLYLRDSVRSRRKAAAGAKPAAGESQA